MIYLFSLLLLTASEKLIVEWGNLNILSDYRRSSYNNKLPSRRGHLIHSQEASMDMKAIIDDIFDGAISETKEENSIKTHRLNIIGIDIVEVDNMTEAIKMKEHIESQGGIAEHDQPIEMFKVPSDPRYGALWGMTAIGAEGMWDYMYDQISPVIVAVFDTGTSILHEDLKGQLWVNEKELYGRPGIDDDGNGYVDDIYGYDFVNNRGIVEADNNHGVHVAGTILATGNNNIGVAGVWWGAKLMTLKIMDMNGSGSYSAAIAAINYASAMGAHIGNHSWGGSANSALLRNSLWNSALLHVCAAGNESINNDVTGSYPAQYTTELENVMSIAAIDRDNNLASFSNWGSKTVDVSAPGASIVSTCMGPASLYCSMSGTSMATPHVSGLAAAVWTAGYRISKKNPLAKYIKNSILSSVKKIASHFGKSKTEGIVNAYNSVINMENIMKLQYPNLSTTSTTTKPITSTSTTTTKPITSTTTMQSSPILYPWSSWTMCYNNVSFRINVETKTC